MRVLPLNNIIKASGRIVKSLAGFYYVDNGSEIIQCRARGKFRKDDVKPLVGDYCDYEIEGENDGYVMHIHPRKNMLIRPPICNVDQAILVFSRNNPAFSTLLLDKFLAIIEHFEIEPIICISKMDLVSDDNIEKHVEDYRRAGYRVLTISSKEKQGLQEFKELFKDKISFITGQSGVGKSSLLNALDDNLNIETNEISKALGRGKHTTRHVELLPLFGGYVGDTPGFSSLELEMDPVELAQSYHDFQELSWQCKFRGCLHVSEPQCAVKAAVEQGMITKERYDHYLQYLQEVKKKKERQYG